MATVSFRFDHSLRRFLPRAQREEAAAARAFQPPVSVKHLIESLGVPHTEVEAILVAGQPVDFAYLVQPEDVITVHSAATAHGLSGAVPLRPPLPNPHRFLLDNHLGRLASYLRLLGFDTAYDPRLDDEALADRSHQEGRILLTRDRGLLKRRQVDHGFCLHARDSKEQLRAVIDRYQLRPHIRPWQRCLRCNHPLAPVSKEAVWDRLEPRTKLYYHEFHRCSSCDHIYWKGSHYLHMQQFLEDL